MLPLIPAGLKRDAFMLQLESRIRDGANAA
jgi:hypothetical protein